MQIARNQACRRNFLRTSILCGAVAMTPQALHASDPAETTVTAEIAAQRLPLSRVRLEIEVEGNVRAGFKKASNRMGVRQLPIKSSASFDYEERALWPEGSTEQSEIIAAQRYYHRANSTGRLNKTTSARTLRDPLRLASVRRDQLPETLYSEQNFFTLDELALLRSPVSSVAIDQWLPRGEVMEGDRFELDSAAICSVLNLTTVDQGVINGAIASIDDASVRIQLKGDVEASIEGVSTKLRTVGKLTYDREARTCTWLALAIHETRDASVGEPGFDVSATIRMLRKPLDKPIRLPVDAPETDFDSLVSKDLLFAELKSDALQFGTMVDRRWKTIQDGPGTTILRVIDHGSSIAQCNVRPLPPLPAGKQLTLEGFQTDVRQALGNRLRQLVSGDQAVSSQGLRVLRIAADGETQGVPIRWIMMHFSNDEGKRLQATFTMSSDKVETFAGSDIQFADSLRFLKASEASQDEKKPGIAATEAPSVDVDQTETRIAELPEDEQAVSASDRF
ncbi:MAG: hypothetical protein AAF802_25585 [Planctomycetota bacterium]